MLVDLLLDKDDGKYVIARDWPEASGADLRPWPPKRRKREMIAEDGDEAVQEEDSESDSWPSSWRA